MKQKLKVALLSITLFTNYVAAQIPFEGTHLTLTSYNQTTIDNSLLSKNLTMDVIMDRLSPITNNNKAPKMGFYTTTNEWTLAPFEWSLYRYETYIPVPVPGEYKGRIAVGTTLPNANHWTNIKVAFRGDPVVSGTGFNGFLSDVATKSGDSWIIESENPVNLKIYVWFDGQYNKGKNDLYDSNGSLIASNKLEHTFNSGKYKLILDDRFSTPQVINIEVKTAPILTKQPEGQTLTEEQTLNLSVNATGGDLLYQWYKNGVAIAGATGDNLSITNVTIDHAGKYKCEVKNPRGTVISNEVTVNITYKEPVIKTSPASQTIEENENLSLSVVADGKGLSYQWQRNGNNIVDARESKYYKANVKVGDAGEYVCLVSNTGGTVKSDAVKITVNYKIPSIITQPKSQEIIEGNALSLSVEASGSNLSYQWKKDNNVINGAVSETYNKLSISKEDAGVYTCVISNPAGTVTTGNAVVTIKNAAPVIQTQPQSQNLTIGSTLNLSVNAVGSDLSYQWKKDDVPIQGATNSSYTKENISSVDEGSYICVVTNTGGLTASDPAVIKIIIISEIPIFDGLKDVYSKGEDPVLLKVSGKGAEKFTVFKVNGLTTTHFNPDKVGSYEVEALSQDGKLSISTYIKVK